MLSISYLQIVALLLNADSEPTCCVLSSLVPTKLQWLKLKACMHCKCASANWTK